MRARSDTNGGSERECATCRHHDSSSSIDKILSNHVQPPYGRTASFRAAKTGVCTHAPLHVHDAGILQHRVDTISRSTPTLAPTETASTSAQPHVRIAKEPDGSESTPSSPTDGERNNTPSAKAQRQMNGITVCSECDGEGRGVCAHAHLHRSCVTGVWYKCTVCTAYLLCSECEHSGVHDEHIMMRVTATSPTAAGVNASLSR